MARSSAGRRGGAYEGWSAPLVCGQSLWDHHGLLVLRARKLRCLVLLSGMWNTVPAAVAAAVAAIAAIAADAATFVSLLFQQQPFAMRRQHERHVRLLLQL